MPSVRSAAMALLFLVASVGGAEVCGVDGEHVCDTSLLQTTLHLESILNHPEATPVNGAAHALCAVAPPACVFPFTYYGEEYTACTDIGTAGVGVYDYCWCATDVNGSGAFVVGSGNYAKCNDKVDLYGAAHDLCAVAPPECVFPFTYYGEEYTACTDIGTGGAGVYDYCWCATDVDGSGAFVIGSGDYTKCNDKAFPPATCDGTWTGRWIQAGYDGDMTLDLSVATSGTGLSGSGTDSIGQFTVDGTVTADAIEFKKQYIGQYALQYTGTSTDGVNFNGGYLNLADNSTGDFVLAAPQLCLDVVKATSPPAPVQAPPAAVCTDTDGGHTDSQGNGCDEYQHCLDGQDGDYSHDYDDEDFTAMDMCCSCKAPGDYVEDRNGSTPVVKAT